MWQVTCAANTLKTLVPFQDSLRAIKRKVAPPRIGPQHDSVISGGIDHITRLRAAGLDLRGARLLEIGTGWFPIIPLMLRTAGAQHVFMTDLHRLLDVRTVIAAADFVAQNQERIFEDIGLAPGSCNLVLDAFDRTLPLEAMLANLGLTYIAPFDPRRQMPEVEAVISQTVFEHIPPQLLEQLLRDLGQALRSGSIMSHGIDNTDHRSHRDRSLNRFDFLKYSDRAWRLFCVDPQDYTNRLRHTDYVEMHGQAGFQILDATALIDPRGLAALSTAKVDARFAARTPKELAVGWSHLVCRKPS